MYTASDWQWKRKALFISEEIVSTYMVTYSSLAAEYFNQKGISMEVEEWRESEGEYLISSFGNLERNGQLIKPRIDRYGYEIVTLWINGVCFTRKIHRLVAIAFIPNPDNLETVNHIDGIKRNNNASNLEWMSIKDNHRHGFATGLHKIGENRTAGRSVKLKEKDIYEIRKLISEGHGNTAIGKKFGVSCGCIYSIRVGKSWSHI
jgi:hypothetical protein